MAGFYYVRHMLGLTTYAVLSKGMILNDSEAFQVGQAVALDGDGLVIAATTTGKVLGILVGIVDKNGIPVTTTGADIDGTVSGQGDTLTYTAAADNSTDKQVCGMICVDKNVVWVNDSSGTLAQTNLGQFFDTSSKTVINQGSASDTAGQFQLVELDPRNLSDVSYGGFRIAESQLDPFAQV